MGGIEGWGCDAPPFCTLFILIPGSSLGRVCTAPPVRNVYVRGRLGERGVMQEIALIDPDLVTMESVPRSSIIRYSKNSCGVFLTEDILTTEAVSWCDTQITVCLRQGEDL